MATNLKISDGDAAAAISLSNKAASRFTANALGNRRWYVVHVNGRFERQMTDERSLTSKLINGAGFEVYSAKLRRMVKPRSNQLTASQRKHRHLYAKERIEPLFPGYEFVLFDIENDPWRDIFQIIGVRGMVCEQNLPAPLPDGFIEQLRRQEVNGAIPAPLPVEQVFRVGETVRVTKPGPMQGLTGPIERLDDADRIRLLLGFFGGAVPAELTADDIEKL